VSAAIPTAKLAEVAELNPPLSVGLSATEEVSFMPMSAVEANSVSAFDCETRSYSEVSKGYTSFLNGDVLVAKITPCFENGKIAQANLTRRYGFGSTEFHVVRPHADRADARYLVHFLRQDSIRRQGESRMTGSAGQRRVPENFLAGLSVPLPPLPEQRRIAEILDKADTLRAKRRTALARLDTLTQSIFLEMFGDPATNPKGVRRQPLGEVIKLKSGDFLPAAEMADSGTYAVLGGNGINGFHDEYEFEEPQIVIGRVGAYCGCVHISPAKSWITDNALYVSERDPSLLFDYLVHALTHAQLNQYASQFGQPLVSGSRLYPVPILIPPQAAQREFVVRVGSAAAMKDGNERSQAHLDELFASLQDRAFRGEL
jgi:type I restriction enzyme, S subunit